MSWRDLLQPEDETITLPWVGGRTLQALNGRAWTLTQTPREFGWYRFSVRGRKATLAESVDPDLSLLGFPKQGYLVGNCLVVPEGKGFRLRTVYLLEAGLDRFSRVSVGSLSEDGPLIYLGQEMPLGPEEGLLNAFLDRVESVTGVPGVTPELEATFWFETRHREEVEKQRAEREARRLQEERMRDQVRLIGTGQGRRDLAKVDFDAAAKAALVVGGAEFLDSRPDIAGNRVVRFRLDGARYECVCDLDLQILESGICLTAEYDDGEFEQGTRGDTWFTLESLPSVIRQAINEHHLVIRRHA